ncbi:metal-dependent hydrolase, partial [Citrobacter freundii]|nr:metal-dependent hydrolase [Citrobacter freundii]
MSQLTYLQGYPENLLSQVRTLIAEQRLGAVLEKRYPGTHDFATDKALWQYTQDLK